MPLAERPKGQGGGEPRKWNFAPEREPRRGAYFDRLAWRPTLMLSLTRMSTV